MSNDYTKALNAYDKTNKSSINDPREVEIRALLKSADRLQALRDNWGNHSVEDIDNALTPNQLLWSIFAGEMQKEETGLDLNIRNNIANLALFTFKRTLEIRAEGAPEKLDILININRNIAAGLQESMNNNQQASAPSGAQAPNPYAGQQAPSPQENSNQPDGTQGGQQSTSDSTDFDI